MARWSQEIKEHRELNKDQGSKGKIRDTLNIRTRKLNQVAETKNRKEIRVTHGPRTKPREHRPGYLYYHLSRSVINLS